MCYRILLSNSHQAMRPVNIESLLADQNKPKFLSKKQRASLKEKKPSGVQLAPKRPLQTSVPSVQTSDPKAAPNKKPKLPNNKFKFDWDAADDTSQDYQPLVSLEDDVDDIGYELHWSEKPLEKLSERDWRIIRDDYNIVSKGEKVRPLRSWDESEFPQEILSILKQQGYEEPTPIQRASIPIARNFHDILGIAETGSGKTLAFLLPMLAYLLNVDKNYMEFEHSQDHNLNKPLGLVLAPTRELALQITQQADVFGKRLGFNTVSIIGGHKYEETVHQLTNGVHIVVATPGRLVDSLERGLIDLSKCYYFVMDEADRMIDMGFEKPLKTVIESLPTTRDLETNQDKSVFKIYKRLTLMFTATLSPEVEKLSKNYLDSPTQLVIGKIGEKVDNIDQRFEYMAKKVQENGEVDKARFDKLLQTINHHVRANPHHLIIIFVNYIKLCEELSSQLNQKHFSSTAIHGSKSQVARERAIADFSRGDKRILVATDIAARGIDVPNVSLVVNFQMSNKFDEYIHRIGRTGRAGNTGASVTFIDDSNADVLKDLRKFLAGNKNIPNWLLNHASVKTDFIKD